jgi:hypothetical protein
MKTLGLIICLFFLFSCSKTEVKPPTLLFTNTDVEAGSNAPTGWWLNSNGTTAAFSWANQIAYSGTRSLEIASTAAISVPAYWGQSVTQNIPFGRNLTLTVRVKGNLSGAGAAVAIACLNATSNTQAQQFSTSQGVSSMFGNFDWTPYTVKLTGVHSDITEIRAYLMILPGGSGQVYFDDISLTAN